MARGGRQVLDQAAPQVHVQELHPTADPKQGQVASQCFIDEGGFDGVPLRIGRFGFRGWRFPRRVPGPRRHRRLARVRDRSRS